jgi:mRNA interferase MazF
MKRGDVFLAKVPHASGSAPKTRPVLVVQSDYYNRRIGNLLVATITSNLARRNDAAHRFIDVTTPDGQQTGLRQDSLVSCLNLAVIPVADVGAKIGELSDGLMREIDAALKAALGLP